MSETTTPDFAKGDGLLPAIVQHARTGEVLMLGYMDEAALAKTREVGLVTFFSRSKQRLWTKGETSGDTLTLVDVRLDCDADTFLVRAVPAGPTCHNGTTSCFGDDLAPSLGFLGELDALVASRHAERPQGSYTTKLFEGGIRRIAQKVGEEGVETALAAVAEDDDALIGEAADLVFHLMVVLRARGIGFDAVAKKLIERHR
ncbi:MAG: bifunctional phosphoribosyl-AMP cyclohydrolase/phosphoribosyl-ATP diphosphatase HisIE [Luteibacter sp.]|uniref:bifunctional phosphoribosyl-AMP cyclohydrolase/phosphoribosyl-ATP diphosphatase HisIE n=1 Tax=Luteibacter sp. TaxID=1886636 RepID=UPI002807D6BC|nr:bifunctional phosphoribosyl-AMP cyclohydrolase/phosphoribosyl-ATP diphosphatase HisIE [Luteibacter sp.]MDQ7995335.1 bifunctional phosphoribosyl-AMP cyclohydrolase/phosphoribosyl-ATP diphosphatase HisIE [Luteibacter sp.]